MMENKKKIENKMDISELVDGIGIYAIQHIASSKVYIGKSVQIRTRLMQHQNALLKGFHYNMKLQNAYNKYGAEAFKAITLELVDEENLGKKELYWSEKYNSFENGYNISAIEEKQTAWYISDEQIAQHKGYKLNKKKVIEICHLLNKKTPLTEIATKFGVKVSAISKIKDGESWVNVSKDILIQDELFKRAKLTKMEVKGICNLMKKQVPIKEIAKKYNVSSKTITNVRNGKIEPDISAKILDKSVKYNTDSKLTDEDVTKICHMINNNVPLTKIKKTFGISYGMVRNIRDGKAWKHKTNLLIKQDSIKRLKLLTSEDVIDICRMINNGILAKKIARKHGIHTTTVYDIANGKSHIDVAKLELNKDNIPFTPILTEDVVVDICNMLNDKKRVFEIAEKHDIPTKTVYEIKNGVIWENVSQLFLKKKPIPRKVLTAKDVTNICIMLNNNIPVKMIAESHQIDISTIYKIKKGKSWANISKSVLKQTLTPSKPEYLTDICYMLDNNIPVKKIAEKHNLPVAKIYRIKYKMVQTPKGENKLNLVT